MTQPAPIRQLAALLYRPTFEGMRYVTDDAALYPSYLQILNSRISKRLQESGQMEVRVIPRKNRRPLRIGTRRAPKYDSVEITVFNGSAALSIILKNTPKDFAVAYPGIVRVNAGRGVTLNVSQLAFLATCKQKGVIDYQYITTAVGGSKMVSFGDQELVPAEKVCWRAIYAGAKAEWFTGMEVEDGIVKADRQLLADTQEI